MHASQQHGFVSRYEYPHLKQEELIGVDALAAHFVDWSNLDVVAVQVCVEERQSVDRSFGFRFVPGPGNQQDFVRL